MLTYLGYLGAVLLAAFGMKVFEWLTIDDDGKDGE